MQADATAGAERSSVVAALKSAAAATGSDFHYLLGTAMRESSLKPGAQSATSSATGLFQFVDQTWLGLVKTHGAQHGLGGYANAINKDGDGHYHADPTQKQAILALRKDPQLSALMAGEYAKATQGQLQANLGRAVCGGELYAAHFLGADAACKLIRLAQSAPAASAAAQFPQAAAANKSVFFHTDGQPKSVREVYDWALRQPGDTGTVRVANLPAIPQADAISARRGVAAANDAEIQMLLANVMNWQPRGQDNPLGGSLGNSLGNLLGLSQSHTPSSAMSFSPSLLGLLSDSKDATS